MGQGPQTFKKTCKTLAKVKSSAVLDTQFNKILEQTTGIEYYKEYSAAKAKTIGASKGKFKFFIPYSAEDFQGLIYSTLSHCITKNIWLSSYIGSLAASLQISRIGNQPLKLQELIDNL